MIFQFMDKYRIQILLVVLFGMAGFGVWSMIIGAFADGSGDEDRPDPSEVMATFELGGESFDATLNQYAEAGRNYGSSGDYKSFTQEQSAAAIANLIRKAMAKTPGYQIATSEDEVNAAFDKVVVERAKAIAEARGESYSEKEHLIPLINSMGVPKEEFLKRMRLELAINKMMREFDRPQRQVTMSEILEANRKQFAKIKLRGVFASSKEFNDEVALKLDASKNLTTESMMRLRKWWDELGDEEKKNYNTKGAMISTEFFGLNFADLTDEALDAHFNKLSEGATATLADLTAEFKASDEDKKKLRLRLDRFKANYGLKPDADIDQVMKDRETRLIQEFKVISLMNKLFVQMNKDLAAGQTIDLESIAKANNLTFFKWRDRGVMDIAKEVDQFGGGFAYQLARAKKGDLFSVSNRPQESFFQGVVDVAGKHVSIFYVNEIDPRPMPKLIDVVDRVKPIFERQAADEKRDELLDEFAKVMNDFCDEKAKDEIAKIKADAAKDLEEALKDLDATKEEDKAKIDELTAASEEETEGLIDEARAPFKGEGFDKALASVKGLIVVEEGYFLPSEATQEVSPAAVKAGGEALARLTMRKEFTSLHDKGYLDEFVDVGTVSDLQVCRQDPSLKGIVKLIDKKDAQFADLMLNTYRLRAAQQIAQRDRTEAAQEAADPWGIDSLKERFGADLAKIEKLNRAKIEEDRIADAETKEWEAKQEERAQRMAAKRAKEAAKKAAEERKKKQPDGENGTPVKDKDAKVPANETEDERAARLAKEKAAAAGK